MERLQDTPEPTLSGQIEDFISQEVGIPTEGVIFQYTEPRQSVMKPNQVRHSQNLAMFTGFWHGSYYWRGQIQKPK